MKSRWTTYLLLAAAAAVWGIVVWKILTPAKEALPAPAAPRRAAAVEVVRDTLRLDYPDPFLKGAPAKPTVSAPVVRPLPPPVVKIQRERIGITHRGTVAMGGRRLYIVTIGKEEYELYPGDQAGEFTCKGCDGDSLYLTKNGLSYGTKLCE